jgi:periplasmic protein TonB
VKLTPGWLRPAAFAVIAALHGALLLGLPAGDRPAPGDAPAAEVSIVPDGDAGLEIASLGLPDAAGKAVAARAAEAASAASPPVAADPFETPSEPSAEPSVPPASLPPEAENQAPPPVAPATEWPPDPSAMPDASPAKPDVAEAPPIDPISRTATEPVVSTPVARPLPPRPSPPPTLRARAMEQPRPAPREQRAAERRREIDREREAERAEKRTREREEQRRVAQALRETRTRAAASSADDLRRQAASAPTVPANPGQPGQTPARGSPQGGGGTRQAVGSGSSGAYAVQVRAILQARANALGLEDVEGVVEVSFSVGASGRLMSHGVTRPSGNFQIDRAIRAMLASMSLPPPPGGSFSGAVLVRVR